MTARGRGWRGRAPPSVWARAARGATAAAGCHAGAAAGVVRSAALTPRAAARRREADMVDGGGVPRGVMGRRGRALSEDLQNSRHLEKNLPRDEEKCTRASSFPGALPPERARGRASEALRVPQRDTASERTSPRTQRDVARQRRRRGGRQEDGVHPRPQPVARVRQVQARAGARRPPGGGPPAVHELVFTPQTRPSRALARRADVPSHAAQCRFFLVGAFSAPPCSFFARRTTNNAPPLPPLPSLPRASSTATRF